VVIKPVSEANRPETEWMRVVPRLSSKLIGGRIVGDASCEHHLSRSRRPDKKHVVVDLTLRKNPRVNATADTTAFD
jgi:hypothetical protein